MILPAENKTNVEEDLTPEQLVGLTTHYVKTIDEVLEFALPSSPREELQDAEEREKVLSTLRQVSVPSSQLPASTWAGNFFPYTGRRGFLRFIVCGDGALPCVCGN